MKLTKKMIGESYPILSLPKGYDNNDFIIGQYYEVVDIKVKKLIIKDVNGTEFSIYSNHIDFNESFNEKEKRKQKFDDTNFGFDWINDKLNIVLPDSYLESNDEDNIKEMGWCIKADAFYKGSEMKEEEIELMLDYFKRKNKIREYQSVINEINKRKNRISEAINELLS